MQARMEKDANAIMKDPRQFLARINAGNPMPTLNDKFKFENFDLIVWEYISKD
jgi:hypothetical protein